MGEIPDDLINAAEALLDEWGMEDKNNLYAFYAARLATDERRAAVAACRKLAEHQKARGQYQDAFTSNFIADQLQAGNHIKPDAASHP